MAQKFANYASTTLASGLTNVAVSMSVASSSGFPSLSAGDYFYAVLTDSSDVNHEVVQVTGISGTTWTIVRGVDGTTGRAWSTGDRVELRVVSANFNDLDIIAAGGNALQNTTSLKTALKLLDALSQPTVKGVGTNTPPGSPALGDAYVVGTSPTGAWAGKGNQIAVWDGSVWVFSGAPKTGWRVLDGSSSSTPMFTWNGTTWTDSVTITANATFFGPLVAVPGRGANLRLRDDTATTRWLMGILGSAGDTNYVIRDLINSLDRLTINSSNGLISIPGGINLGQQDLKNYSEGTWTPTLLGATTAGTPTYTIQLGLYRRIGNICIASFDVKISTKGGIAGSVRVGGMPFASSSFGQDCGIIGYMEAFTYGTATPFLITNPGTTQLNIFSTVSGGSGGQIQDTALANTTRLFGHIVYQI